MRIVILLMLLTGCAHQRVTFDTLESRCLERGGMWLSDYESFLDGWEETGAKCLHFPPAIAERMRIMLEAVSHRPNP